MTTKMRYGDYWFTPVPLMQMQKVYTKVNDTQIGNSVIVTLEGTLVAITNNQSGIVALDVKMDALRDALKYDGWPFVIQCDDSTPWFSGRPFVKDLTFDRSSNNWVFTVPYTIQLEFLETSPHEDWWSYARHYIKEVSHNVTLEPLAEYSPYSWLLPNGAVDASRQKYRLESTVTAVGRDYFSTGMIEGANPFTPSTQGWVNAKNFILDYCRDIEQPSVTWAGTGLYFGLNTLTGLNHYRTTSYDHWAGSFTLNESWLLVDTGVGGSGYHGDAIEDFTINISKGATEPITTVSIEGQIQGCEKRDYFGTTVIASKYATASGYWKNVRPLLYHRANYLGSGSVYRPLNVLSLTESVAHNPSKGTINYNYSFNDRRNTCYTGAYQETIVINDTRPTDVFAQLLVIGRAAGPVLQDMGTKTAYTRTVSIDAVVNPADICPSASGNINAWLSYRPTAYDAYITAVQNNLISNGWSQIFKTNDNESWDGSNGRYSRSVTWTYSDCV